MLPATIWEENEQKVNGLRINRLLANNWEFSSSESLELLNISAQCPRTNGLSVYQASTVLIFAKLRKMGSC